MTMIISDSTCDLSAELVKKFNLEIIPLSVLVAGKNYLDGVEITTPMLFDLVEKKWRVAKNFCTVH